MTLYNMSHGVSQTDTMGKTFWTKEQLRAKTLTKMGVWQHVRTRRQHQRLKQVQKR